LALTLAVAVDPRQGPGPRADAAVQYNASISLDDARAMGASSASLRRDLDRADVFRLSGVAGARIKDRPIDAAEENIQARIRGTLLMALSNKFGSIVLTTGNKSEMAVGYATLYGDMAGDSQC